MVILGVDPGVHGAIAITDNFGNVEVHRMTTLKNREGELNIAIRERLKRLKEEDNNILAYVERVHGNPQWGYKNFKFGKYNGIILGALWMLSIPVSLVSPITWRAEIHGQIKRMKKDKSLNDKEQRKLVSVRYKAKKVKNRQIAGKLYPKLAYLLKTRNSDGIADALLIMEYGRREMGLMSTVGIPDKEVDVAGEDIFL